MPTNKENTEETALAETSTQAAGADSERLGSATDHADRFLILRLDTVRTRLQDFTDGARVGGNRNERWLTVFDEAVAVMGDAANVLAKQRHQRTEDFP
jgi:hypothetical protein